MSEIERALPLNELIAETTQERYELQQAELVTTYLESLSKSAPQSLGDYELAHDSGRMRNIFTEDEIGEPLRLCGQYRNDLYCTKSGDCYQLLDSGRYKYMSKLVDQYGDLVVRPTYGRTTQNIKIKRIVAHAWLEVPEELKGYKLLWVKLKDGDKKNIHASNIEWEQPYIRGKKSVKSL